MRPAGATFPLVLILACIELHNAASLRSLPAKRPLAVQALKLPPMHTVLAKASSDTSTNASSEVNATANSNGTSYPFRAASHGPAVGKVFALYFSTMSGQKVSQIWARNYKALPAAPSDPAVFDPETGAQLARGKCNLRLTSANYAAGQRKYNLRLAEVAVCEQFFGSPCGPGAKGCEIEIMAPLPYDGQQEKYIGAGMALTAHSLLCAQRTETWRRDSCAIIRDKAAIAAGLMRTSSGIKLRPIPGEWTDLKMDAAWELQFKEAVFSSANKGHYEESTHNEKRHDVLAWPRTPSQAAFCEGLACLVQKFQVGGSQAR